MADGRKNNGGHSTKGRAGRPPKADELKIKELGLSAIVSEYGSEEDYWIHIARESKESMPHLKMLTEYIYGKPKETKDIKVEQVPIVNMNEWK